MSCRDRICKEKLLFKFVLCNFSLVIQFEENLDKSVPPYWTASSEFVHPYSWILSNLYFGYFMKSPVNQSPVTYGNVVNAVLRLSRIISKRFRIAGNLSTDLPASRVIKSSNRIYHNINRNLVTDIVIRNI